MLSEHDSLGALFDFLGCKGWVCGVVLFSWLLALHRLLRDILSHMLYTNKNRRSWGCNASRREEGSRRFPPFYLFILRRTGKNQVKIGLSAGASCCPCKRCLPCAGKPSRTLPPLTYIRKGRQRNRDNSCLLPARFPPTQPKPGHKPHYFDQQNCCTSGKETAAWYRAEQGRGTSARPLSSESGKHRKY